MNLLSLPPSLLLALALTLARPFAHAQQEQPSEPAPAIPGDRVFSFVAAGATPSFGTIAFTLPTDPAQTGGTSLTFSESPTMTATGGLGGSHIPTSEPTSEEKSSTTTSGGRSATGTSRPTGTGSRATGAGATPTQGSGAAAGAGAGRGGSTVALVVALGVGVAGWVGL